MAEKSPVMIVRPCRRLEGEISPPGDKSVSHRAVLFNSFAQGKAEVTNLAPGKDVASTISCLRALGVKIERDGGRATVHGLAPDGRYSEPEGVLNAGNSGTTIRLMSGLLAAQPIFSIITGDASLRSRPMKRVIEPLRLMGAEIRGRANDSFAPLAISGRRLSGIRYRLPVASAQLKSALLTAALFANGETVLEEPAPSRDHTERMLKRMGVRIKKLANGVELKPPTRPLPALSLRIPGDISSAAFFMVAAAIHPNARITITGCGVNPTRTGIIDVLIQMGANLKVINQRLEGDEPVADIAVESSRLKGVTVGGDLIPRLIDEIPVLAVAACVARGRTVIKDAAELRLKESDRVATVVEGLSRMGARIEARPDGMVVDGGYPLHGAAVSSHHDHRLAMSLAVAALIASGETAVEQAGSVAISYPGFWQDLESLKKD